MSENRGGGFDSHFRCYWWIETDLTISKQSFLVNWWQFHQTSSPIFFVYADNTKTSPLTPGCEGD